MTTRTYRLDQGSPRHGLGFACRYLARARCAATVLALVAVLVLLAGPQQARADDASPGAADVEPSAALTALLASTAADRDAAYLAWQGSWRVAAAPLAERLTWSKWHTALYLVDASKQDATILELEARQAAYCAAIAKLPEVAASRRAQADLLARLQAGAAPIVDAIDRRRRFLNRVIAIDDALDAAREGLDAQDTRIIALAASADPTKLAGARALLTLSRRQIARLEDLRASNDVDAQAFVPADQAADVYILFRRQLAACEPLQARLLALQSELAVLDTALALPGVATVIEQRGDVGETHQNGLYTVHCNGPDAYFRYQFADGTQIELFGNSAAIFAAPSQDDGRQTYSLYYGSSRVVGHASFGTPETQVIVNGDALVQLIDGHIHVSVPPGGAIDSGNVAHVTVQQTAKALPSGAGQAIAINITQVARSPLSLTEYLDQLAELRAGQSAAEPEPEAAP